MTGGMEKNVIDLYTLQTHLKTVLEGAFPARLWVKAEISAVKARPGGHCYMELSQSDGNGLVAKVTAIIWSSKFRFLAPYFESETGIPLQAGTFSSSFLERKPPLSERVLTMLFARAGPIPET